MASRIVFKASENAATVLRLNDSAAGALLLGDGVYSADQRSARAILADAENYSSRIGWQAGVWRPCQAVAARIRREFARLGKIV